MNQRAGDNADGDPTVDSSDPGNETYESLLHRLAKGSTLGGAVQLRGVELANGRFYVETCIGRGGMGVVYAAFDRERQARVALKTLNHRDGTSVYGLKNEFRALANVNHPNLIRLHELFGDGTHWFFTMDLIEGERFDRWVRPQGRTDFPRLRSALAQLTDAIDALHTAGSCIAT